MRLALDQLKLEGIVEQARHTIGISPVEGLSTPGGGGGWKGRSTSKCSATPPFGAHEASASRPPGRQTRVSSRAAASWCGANMTPMQEQTASKLASS